MKTFAILALLGLASAFERLPLHKVDSPRKQMVRDQVWESFARHQLKHQVLSEVFGLAAQGDDRLTTQVDFQYLAEVQIGTPAQTFHIVPDTGSPIFWVVDSTCGQALQCCGFEIMGMCFGGRSSTCNAREHGAVFARSPCQGKSKFNSAASSSYQSDGKPFKIGYGDGSSSKGFYGVDKVTFSGVTVTTHVAQANQLAQRFAYSQLDGILGLSFPELNSRQFGGDGTAPVVTGDMVQQGVLAQNVFGVLMTEKGGELHLGGVDHSAFTGSINYIPITRRGFWQFNLDSVSINGQQVGGGGVAISDTGTSVIAVPTNILKTIAQTLGTTDFDKNQQLFKMDCNANLPNVDFAINGQTYSIPVQHYKIDLTAASGGQLGCYLGIGANPPGGGVNFILGDSFLRAYYAIYDIDNERVGFARQ